MERRVDYETKDKNMSDYWSMKIYVQRSFTIDVPDKDTLFKIIDVLWEWYEELRLRKLERIDYVQQYEKHKSKTWKWKWSTFTIDEDDRTNYVLCNS
jgi:hypothetical protein